MGSLGHMDVLSLGLNCATGTEFMTDHVRTLQSVTNACGGGEKLCLSDLILPAREGQRDHLALLVVTAGAGIREKSEEAKTAGEYLFSHGLQALALETAEACAEWLDRRICEDWGFPDPATLTMAERFTSRYRGKRYSFGYFACPNLPRSSRHLDAATSRGRWRPSHRRDDDGPGSQHKRARFPPSRLHVFFGRRTTTRTTTRSTT
jgi:hypothetical protein